MGDQRNWGQTLREAIESAGQLPEGNQRWETLAATQLDQLAMPPPHPYTILSEWGMKLPERNRTLLESRIIPIQPERSLHDIGGQYGVSRERIRQLENNTRAKLRKFLETGEAVPIIMKAAQVRGAIRTAAPEAEVQDILHPPPGVPDLVDLILQIAGPYLRYNDGWLVLEEQEDLNPTDRIIQSADWMGRIDQEAAARELHEWGVREHFQKAWLLRHPMMWDLMGCPTIWRTNIGNRIALVLDFIQRPATMDEIFTILGETSKKSNAVNALTNNPRITRTSMKHWGLTEWQLPRYEGTAQAIRYILEKEGRPLPIGIITHSASLIFDIAENTARAYCHAPMFVHRDRTVRLRTEEDGPLICSTRRLRNSAGTFRLGPRRVARIIQVNRETLRGSGITIREAAGGILGMKAGDDLLFTGQNDETARVTFPETTINGPCMGSIMETLERLGARKGDHLTITLDALKMSFSAELIQQEEIQMDWEIMGRMTGLGRKASHESLAQAMRCQPDQVRSNLRNRNDPAYPCLPETPRRTQQSEDESNAE